MKQEKIRVYRRCLHCYHLQEFESPTDNRDIIAGITEEGFCARCGNKLMVQEDFLSTIRRILYFESGRLLNYISVRVAKY